MATWLSILIAKAKEYEVFTVVPIKKMSSGSAFAPIGLVKMFNSGGAITEVKYEAEATGAVCMKVRGCGEFGAYSSVRPRRIAVDSTEVEFQYEDASGFITFELGIPEKEMYLWDVVVDL
nr:probable galactinol--sucrose galactosyltransferase 1 [Ipomoea batatas]